jgi:hypothetical protein
VLKRILIGLVSLAVISSISFFLRKDARSCSELVRHANVAVGVLNARGSSALVGDKSEEVSAILAQLDESAGTVANDAKDYSEPFKSEARDLARDLTALRSAISTKNVNAEEAATQQYNSDIRKVNQDCKAKS